MIVAFIDAQRDQFGIEPICAVLQVAPSTFRFTVFGSTPHTSPAARHDARRAYASTTSMFFLADNM